MPPRCPPPPSSPRGLPSRNENLAEAGHTKKGRGMARPTENTLPVGALAGVAWCVPRCVKMEVVGVNASAETSDIPNPNDMANYGPKLATLFSPLPWAPVRACPGPGPDAYLPTHPHLPCRKVVTLLFFLCLQVSACEAPGRASGGERGARFVPDSSRFGEERLGVLSCSAFLRFWGPCSAGPAYPACAIGTPDGPDLRGYSTVSDS